MAARANWKGVLKIGEVSCPVALYTAASTVERITFHILNRKTGNRVHREFVDAETGKRVEPKEQIKGYEVGAGDYVLPPDHARKADNPLCDEKEALERLVLNSPGNQQLFKRDRTTVWRHFQAAARAAGLKLTAAHIRGMKHTLGTLAAEKIPLKQLQMQMQLDK